MKRVLMIAYHFPPIQGSSGVHRTVQFARHLPGFGWAPIVVSIHPRAYPAIGDESWAKLPAETIVKRAFAMDSARHLSVKGRYLDVTAIPDRWVSWLPAGVFECLRLIKRYKPHVLWSTYPIATAHLIGLVVNRLTGLPWVADFRDPMVQKGQQPISRINHKVHQFLEREVVRSSSSCTLVSRSALDDYRQRYPDKKPESWQVIENGYDESLFELYDHLYDDNNSAGWDDQPIRILHSGILYPLGRDPLSFLEAIKSVVEEHKINMEVIFRGCGFEERVAEQINHLKLAHVVKLLPSISYDKAIQEMIQSDVLALFQGAAFNNQIPAKIYEYIRAGRPILAMTDESGETARSLREWDGVYFADIVSQESIESSLLNLVNDLKSKKKVFRNTEAVKLLSRYSGTKKLNDVLSAVSAMP